MQIIGEKINGTRREVAEAIAARDGDTIRRLAIAQADAGSAYLDVNAGTPPDREPDDLCWLVETVQDAVEVPLCLDSANAAALAAALPECARTPMVNSVSGERYRLEGPLPLAAAHSCPVVALALDDSGMPTGVEDRLAVVHRLIGETRGVGIPDEHVYVDPLIIAVSTGDEQGAIALEVMRRVRAELPDVHLTGGLSNVSFGMPARSLLNRAFAVLAIQAGLDTLIADPTDRELLGLILATGALLGRDRFCRTYNTAFRAGRIGPARTAA